MARSEKKRMGGAERCLIWNSNNPFSAAGLSELFPRWRRWCNGEKEAAIKSVLHQSSSGCFVTVCFAVVYSMFFLMPVQRCFQSSVVVFFPALQSCDAWSSFGSTLNSTPLPLTWVSSQSTKQCRCRKHREVGFGPWLHLYNSILVDFPLVSLISESLFCISATWIFPQKPSSRVETTETAKDVCVCVYMPEGEIHPEPSYTTVGSVLHIFGAF